MKIFLFFLKIKYLNIIKLISIINPIINNDNYYITIYNIIILINLIINNFNIIIIIIIIIKSFYY